MLKSTFFKLSLLSLIILIVLFIYSSDYYYYLNISYVIDNYRVIQSYMSNNYILSAVIYGVFYAICVILAFPVASFLTVLSGYFFGFKVGLLVASVSSTIGAYFSFLLSRYLLRGYLERRFYHIFKTLNSNLTKKSSYKYLFFIRINPIFPYWLTNMVLGLTRITSFQYIISTFFGAFLVTAAYTSVGSSLINVSNLQDIQYLKLILIFSFLSSLPFVISHLFTRVSQYKLYKFFKKPKNIQYDVAVIGAGSAGLIAAYTSAFTKAKVALIESNKMGGDCLNEGCVPSKAFLNASKRYSADKAAKEDAMQYVQNVISKIQPKDSKERYQQEIGVSNVISGKAKLITPYEISITNQQKQETITAKKVIIATGAKPFVPNIKGIENINYLTSNNLWNLKKIPSSIAIVGGGAIGVEMSYAFSNFGCKVTLIEKAPEILIKNEPEVRSFIRKYLETKHVEVYTSVDIENIKEENNKKIINLGKREVQVDEVLFALGRKPNIEDIWDKKLDIELHPGNGIQVNRYLQSNYHTIFACGDVSTKYQLTHVGAYEGQIAAINALFGFIKKKKVSYKKIPAVMYGNYEVASIGITEQEAKDNKFVYDVIYSDISNVDRLITENEQGLIKIILNKKNKRILGCSIVSSRAGEMIYSVGICMQNKLTIDNLYNTMVAYPIYSEGIREAISKYKKENLNKRVFSIFKLLHKIRG